MADEHQLLGRRPRQLDIARCGVSATTVHPGGIKTNIASNGRVHHSVLEQSGRTRADLDKAFSRIAVTSPERAAKEILAAVQANRRRALIGVDANVIDFLARLPGSALHRLMALGDRARR